MMGYIELITAFVLIGSLLVAIFHVSLLRREIQTHYKQLNFLREEVEAQQKQVALLNKQIAAQHDWNRRVTALRYSFCNDPEIRRIRSRVERELGIYGKPEQELPRDKIENLEKEKPDLMRDVNFVLGRLAAMCAAINNGIVDEQVCKDLLRGTVIRFYRFFRQFILHARGIRHNDEVYSCLEHYAEKWEQDELEIKQRQPTGS